MKLFTKDINQKLFAQYRIGSNLNKQKVVAKIFNPYGEGRWYLLNSDPNDPDYLWAIVQMGDEVEIGSVSRRELESIRIKPFGLPLERDMYFNDRNAMEVLEGLEKGQTFALGGMTAGRYYRDNKGEELRFVGESQGKLLFKDGEKYVYKDESDFENDFSKEKKLFGFFEEGGETEEGVDLFEDYDEIPDNVQEILQKYDFEEGDYRTLEKAKKDVEKVGYTFEYSLDGTAYDLRKIGQKGKSEDEEYAKGGQVLDLKDVYNELRSKVGRLEINEESKDYIYCDIRDWGNWEHDYEDYERDEEDFEDDDSMILSENSAKKMQTIVEEIRTKYPTASIRWNTSEKNYIDFNISRKETMADGGELDDEDSLDYNSISDLQSERNRLVRWKYQYNSKGADYKIKQLEERIEYLKSKDSKMADGGTTKSTVKLTLSDIDSYDYTYKQDGATASITFGFGKEPFQYEVKKISKSLEPLKQDILDAFTIQGIKQHEYKGGFSEAIKHLDTKVVYEDNMAKGGKVKFEDKVKAIKESLLKRKKVSPKVQKDYGKTYSPKEAEESAKRIAASQRMKYELKKKFKKGGRTIAQTPAPKKDRVFGSSKNKAGSASSKKTASNIELNESIVKTLAEKAKEYNEKHSSKVSTSTLKAVMRRGMGAFSTSHRPGMTRQGWGYARVNKFLKKKGGAQVKAAYVQDDDLL